MTDLNLAPIRARISAAKARLEQLSEAVDGFLSGEPPYDVYIEPTSDLGMFAVRLRVRRDPPIEWGVDVGDIAHGLRSALNELVTELVRANGQKTGFRNQFPIFTDQHKYWGKAPRRKLSRRDEALRGMSRDNKRLIDAVQPFGRVPASSNRDPFARLQWLNNQDKHVSLQPSFVKVEKWGAGAKHPKDGPVPKMLMRLSRLDVRGPMKDGELLIEIGWPGQAGVEPRVEEISCKVGFGDRGIIVEELDQMILAVSALVDRVDSANLD